ncbi:MAG: DHH family phosphoesterase [Patescibacteria group bacterium]
MIFIVSCHSPDVDAIACSIGYSELLKKKGIVVCPTYFGDLSKEVEFVRKYTDFFPPKKHEGKYPDGSEFILVDVSDPADIESVIPPEKVVEVFDHRELVFTDEFVNAKLNIEKVGSCATLITEKFEKEDIEPSRNTAIYLYSAIISNTINFKNLVTTRRDIDMANWLKSISQISDDYVRQMFEYKSKIRNANDLIFLIEQDFATKTTRGKNVGIAQIEIVNLEEVINLYRKDIEKSIERIKKEEKDDYILFSGIDIVRGFNIFITLDNRSEELFSRVLEIPKIGGGYKTDEIIMRKQIRPKIEKYLTK